MKVLGAMVAVCAVVAAGCGGGDSGGGSGGRGIKGSTDEAAITTAVKDYLGGDGKLICDTVLSERYLKQNWPAADPQARCEKDPPGQLSKGEAATVSSISVSGSTATAKGAANGVTAKVKLVKESDRWEIDDVQ